MVASNCELRPRVTSTSLRLMNMIPPLSPAILHLVTPRCHRCRPPVTGLHVLEHMGIRLRRCLCCWKRQRDLVDVRSPRHRCNAAAVGNAHVRPAAANSASTSMATSATSTAVRVWPRPGTRMALVARHGRPHLVLLEVDDPELAQTDTQVRFEL